MAYMQVREILEYAATFHARLADSYRWIECQVEDDRKRLFLEFLARSEDDFRQVLLDFIRNNHSNALKTWLHFIPPTELNLHDLPHKDMSVDEMARAAMRLDRSLRTMYDRVSTYTSAPNTQEVLGRLRELLDERERKIAIAVLEETGS